MTREKKNTVKVTYTIDKTVSDMIDKYNETTFVSKTRIVEEAVKEYITKRKKKHD